MPVEPIQFYFRAFAVGLQERVCVAYAGRVSNKNRDLLNALEVVEPVGLSHVLWTAPNVEYRGVKFAQVLPSFHLRHGGHTGKLSFRGFIKTPLLSIISALARGSIAVLIAISPPQL